MLPPSSSGRSRSGRFPRSLAGGVLALLFALASAIGLGLSSPLPAKAAMDVAKQVLIGADFHDQDLRGATFNLTNLRDSTFAG